jgi:hypothetical protein
MTNFTTKRLSLVAVLTAVSTAGEPRAAAQVEPWPAEMATHHGVRRTLDFPDHNPSQATRGLIQLFDGEKFDVSLVMSA